jgi:hypothetical protein
MPMLAGVGLLVVCCSSSSAMMMMGGGEETTDPVGGDDSSSGGAGAGAGDDSSSGGAGAGAGDDSSGGDAGVENEYIVVDESHVSPLRAGHVETGAGTSVEDCRKLAYDGDYAAFGFRKAMDSAGRGSCWAIVDGEDTAGRVVPIADHAVGCVTAGEDINAGCKTTKTNVLRARHYSGFTSHQDIACNNIASCRTAAIAAGANHFGWRETRGNGWVIKAPAISSTTPQLALNHTIGCTDPTKRPPNC